MTEIEINYKLPTLGGVDTKLPHLKYDKSFEIDIINDTIEYSDFFDKFMTRNKPCLIKNVSKGWKCSNKWINNNMINYDYFKSTYGDMEAPVVDCNNKSNDCHCKSAMTVSNYMVYLATENKHQILYLKDWHLRRNKPDDNFYQVPLLFASDWLNEYAIDTQDDDFMFVYIGPKNSLTPLHADVYSSFSWSVNIIGAKKWLLFPPGEENKLKDSLGNLPSLFASELHVNVKHIEIVQEKGDAIFVPSCWYHQVHNLVDTISINHNFVNACNIEVVWQALQSNLISVEKIIEEFKSTEGFTEQCQKILKCDFGMDFVSFINFILHIANKRLLQYHGRNHVLFEKYSLGFEHVLFDLNVILKIMKSIQCHPLFTNKSITINVEHFNDIENQINEVVKTNLYKCDLFNA